jgi:hypothetical protein
MADPPRATPSVMASATTHAQPEAFVTNLGMPTWPSRATRGGSTTLSPSDTLEPAIRLGFGKCPALRSTSGYTASKPCTGLTALHPEPEFKHLPPRSLRPRRGTSPYDPCLNSKHLPRVQNPLRIQRLFHRAHHRQRLGAMLLLQELALADAHAVLAAARPAQRESTGGNLLVQLPRACAERGSPRTFRAGCNV